MNLESLTIIEGILGIISISISIFLGIKMISKYFVFKKIEFITMGLTMIFVSNGWWGSALAFVLYALFNFEISDTLYIFISYGLSPIAFMFWTYTFCHLVYRKLKWQIVGVFLAISVLYEIFFFTFLFSNPSILAERVARSDSEANLYVFSYLIFILLTTLITYTIFFRQCLKSENSKIRLKGLFIYIGIIIFIIGTFIDAFISLTILTLFITRMILIFSGILTYIGWVMPNRVAKWIIKDQM